MSIKVVQEKTKFEWEMEGSIFTYNNLNFLQKKRLLFSHMTNGTINDDDSLELAYAVMKEMVVDWKGVETEEGKMLPFKKEHIDGLPLEPVLTFLDDIIYPQFEEFFNVRDRLAKKGKKETELGRRDEESKNSKPM